MSKRIFLFFVLIFVGGVFFVKSFFTSSLPQLQTPKDISSNLSQPNTAGTPSSPNSQNQVASIPFQLPVGFQIRLFAKGLINPRDLQFSPAGTLLVSIPSKNQVIALPDKNHDGVVDEQKVIINKGNHIHGLAFYQNKLFVAEVDKVVRYDWNEETLAATQEKVLFSLPNNNNHNNRTLTFDQAGNLYLSLGSTCNVCDETPEKGGSVLISNAEGQNVRVFARGVRNAPFLVLHPQTDALWSTGMGRDHLGDNLPPDEINILQENTDYGWPFCYGQKVHDDNFDPRSSHSCNNTQSPIFEIPAHSAPLGLTFINSTQFPEAWQGDLLVAYHGSWNRSTPIGYKVVHLKVQGNTILRSEDFLTGFMQGSKNGDALGRPVDVIFDQAGNLYISDDKAGNVYIVQKVKA